ncbi:MAG: hypothetical protein KBS75_09140 [Bacteroidales bacterium]|nr:hypothetical protein [Candidatus Equimonas faecalis]
MTQNIFSIDGTFFNVRIPEKGIKRSFAILDGENAGRVKSGRMDRDIIGTYYNYTVQIDTSALDRAEYDNLYEIVSMPVDYHIIRVPYGQTTLEFEAYVTAGEDVLNLVSNGSNEWGGLSLQFIAMEPYREG